MLILLAVGILGFTIVEGDSKVNYKNAAMSSSDQFNNIDEAGFQGPIYSKSFQGAMDPEVSVVDLMKDKFYDVTRLNNDKFPRRSGNTAVRRKTIVFHDDPNLRQAMMAHAFINSLNDGLRMDDDGDAHDRLTQSGGGQLNGSCSNFARMASSPSNGRGNVAKLTSGNDFEVDDKERTVDGPSINIGMQQPSSLTRRRKSSDSTVHCIRTAPYTIECTHENFTYSLTLPEGLVKQEAIENLISAISSVVEVPNQVGATISLVVKETMDKIASPEMLNAVSVQDDHVHDIPRGSKDDDIEHALVNNSIK